MGTTREFLKVVILQLVVETIAIILAAGHAECRVVKPLSLESLA